MSHEIEMRQRLLALAKEFPGLHVREASRQLKTSVALVEYHLAALVKDGLLDAVQDQRFVRIHAAKGAARVATEDHAALHALRGERGLAIALYLLENPTGAHGEIARGLDVSPTTLTFHLNKLKAVGLVESTPNGYRLTDPDQMRRLLISYRPTPSMRERFAAMWDTFYGGI